MLKLNFHSTLASAYDSRSNMYKLIPIYTLSGVVMADSVNSFKSCLDKFWSLRDFV